MMSVDTIRQTEAAECGLACLAIVAGLLGNEIELSSLRRRYPVSNRGLTLEDLTRIAPGLQLYARSLRCEIDELREVAVPAILHWGFNHFVVLKQVNRTHLLLHDPARGIIKVPLAEASKKFTGVVVELHKTPSFTKRKERSPLKLSSLVRWSPATISGLLQILLLSVLLQVYVIASPLYMQLAIDEAALKGDASLLIALAIGFGLFGLFNVGATALRGVALQKISALIGWDMTGRLFHHLVRLPLPWFQRRKLADTLSRFESIEPVRQMFANGLVTSVIDGVLAIGTLVMMMILEWKLGIVAMTGVSIYIVLRIASLPLSIRLAGEALGASISENGKRIETLRAIQTIKVMGAESQRQDDWSNRFAEVVRTNQRAGFLNIGLLSAQGMIDAIVNVALIYLAATSLMKGDMTVGMIYAFMSYKSQFTSRIQDLFNTYVNWKMMDLHSERIADIALTQTEKGLDGTGAGLNEMIGHIELRNVAFRYAPHEPIVFQGVSANIAPGEFVAVVGPSGSGKSTLLKVVCGLYPATSGDIHIDGVPLSAWGPQALRKNLGVVMQDDELLSGSIAENVAFFSSQIDMEWVWECLRMAAIDDDVRAMVMRAETHIGDMGSALSGGQKQRILLARAFYRRPKILILDEATSHLDVHRETAINEALKNQKITRLIVAHRQETIKAADRILHLNGGRLVDMSMPKITKLDDAAIA